VFLCLSACTVPTIPAPGPTPPSAGANELAPGFVPDLSDLPDGATPIAGPAELGLSDGTPKRPDGSITTVEVRCDEAMMHIDTSRGTYLARVPRAGDWGCSKALEQWKQASPSDGPIGLRYVGPSAGDEQLTLISDNGASLTMRVNGFWQGS
jgi:hypothetical protein